MNHLSGPHVFTEPRSCYTAQAGLKLMILMPQLLKEQGQQVFTERFKVLPAIPEQVPSFSRPSWHPGSGFPRLTTKTLDLGNRGDLCQGTELGAELKPKRI